VAVFREFSKEEVSMQETKRMVDEANRMGRQAQEGMQSGFEAASRSLGEANKGFQALAAEMMEYSKAAFDDGIRTWGELIGVRSLEQAIQIQSDYAKRVYENHMAELSKLGEMCMGMVRDTSKPVEDAQRRLR
jgi:hypothetical protein